jgi:MFS family permease
LFINAQLAQPHLWAIYVIASLASAINGFHRPTLEAITQVLIFKREDMPAVSALVSFRFGVTTVLGPALAGFLLVKFNIKIVYLIDLLTYLGSFLAIVLIKTSLKLNTTHQPILQSIKQGLRYAMSRQELLGSYLIDFVAMVFGMPIALFPAIAESYHSAVALGWLYTAPSIGLLFASIFSGWTQHIQRHGMAIAAAACMWGLAIVAFGCTYNIYLAMLFLALAGAADEVSALFRITLWNQTIPKNFRGRLAGIEMISYMSGPLLGNAEAGLVAGAFNTQVSIISGGILCIFTVIILAILLPRFWKYTANTSIINAE